MKMYEIDILENGKWVYHYDDENINYAHTDRCIGHLHSSCLSQNKCQKPYYRWSGDDKQPGK